MIVRIAFYMLFSSLYREILHDCIVFLSMNRI